jgi:hypothetical protein
MLKGNRDSLKPNAKAKPKTQEQLRRKMQLRKASIRKPLKRDLVYQLDVNGKAH